MIERRQHMETKEMQEWRMIMWARKLMKATVVEDAMWRGQKRNDDADVDDADDHVDEADDDYDDDGYRGQSCERDDDDDTIW